MPHDHHGHSHAHLDPSSGDRRVAVAIWANGLLTVAQIVGGIFAGSLALIADALHNFSDMAALVIAFAARKIARRPADERMTFGYGRIETVAALINYTTLIMIGLYLIYEGGIANMNYSISNTAAWGEYVSGPRIITAETKDEMRRVLKDIQTGRFTSEWMQEWHSGAARFKGTRRMNDDHQIEEVGEKLRGMMHWAQNDRLVDKSRN